MSHLRGSFDLAQHCFTVSVIPSVIFSILFPPFSPPRCCLAVWAGRIRRGTASVLPRLMRLCFFRQTIKIILIYIYIYVWLSFSLCLGFCKILHGKEVRAYDIYARVVDVSEIERVSVANEWHLWYKNECVDTVQSTFHVVLCLFYTYWDIHHFSSLFVLLSKKYQLITIVKTFVKNASDYDSE